MWCGKLGGRAIWGRIDTCTWMTESIHCSPETITTLLISYTQNKPGNPVVKTRLPMQETRVQSLTWEDPTCRRTAKPVCHNYWAWALEPGCCLVAQLCLTLCDPTDCSTPGFSVLHHFPELAQTHVHWVSDAIQPSCPLSSPSPAFNLSQHHGLFLWVGSVRQVAKVFELQLQHQSFQWIFRAVSFRMDWFDLLQSKELSRVFSNTTVQKHQFFGTQPSLWSCSHICTWLLEKP